MFDPLAWISPAALIYATPLGSACPSPEPIDRVTAPASCRPERPGSHSVHAKSIPCIRVIQEG